MIKTIDLYSRLSKLKASRYRNLLKIIYKNKCSNIVEIGTFDAENSKQMIEVSKMFNDPADINYYGFDLFEGLTDEELKKEFSKRPPSKKAVEQKLNKTGVNIHLFKGYTKKTLPEFVKKYSKKARFDFIFIDGGHYIETIKLDWKYVQKLMDKNTIVVFDDYYSNEEPEIDRLGCQSIIDNLNRSKYEVEILRPQNRFDKSWGTLKVNMVKVTLKR